jgi:hypothetical protein
LTFDSSFFLPFPGACQDLDQLNSPANRWWCLVPQFEKQLHQMCRRASKVSLAVLVLFLCMVATTVATYPFVVAASSAGTPCGESHKRWVENARHGKRDPWQVLYFDPLPWVHAANAMALLVSLVCEIRFLLASPHNASASPIDLALDRKCERGWVLLFVFAKKMPSFNQCCWLTCALAIS